MGRGTQTPLRHEHAPGMSARMDRFHVGQIVREEGRDHELQEESGARMEEPQEPRPGKAAPRLLHRGLPERLLEGRGIGQGAP
jgi:hypothetical protein